MNYDPMPITIKSTTSIPTSFEPNNKKSTKNGRLESVGFYVFLATVVLAPIAFLPSAFISLDVVKTFVIAIGTIVSVAILGYVTLKERTVKLPPRALLWTSALMVVSLVISSALSIHFGKSFFGQGYEIDTSSFIIILFLAGLSIFTLVNKQKDRAIVVYVGIVIAYVVLYILHLLRFLFGDSFMTLGILNSMTTSVIGGWYNLSSFSVLIAIISLLALYFLKLSSRMKVVYWILLVISVVGTVVVADIRVWKAALLVFFGLTVFFSLERYKTNSISMGKGFKSMLRSLSVLPLLAFIISVVFVWQGYNIANPVINKINADHAELVLPWQMTLNVTASVLQNYPLFGVGSNNFSQAYMAYKPLGINTTNAWATEFSSGFGLLPTFVTTQGLFGSILWVLLFVFFGIIATKTLRNLPNTTEDRFMIVSSLASAVFLWLVSIVSTPSHAIIFLAFVFTGIFVGLATVTGSVGQREYTSRSSMGKMLPSFVIIFVLVVVVLGLMHTKKTLALVYFGNGIKQLTVTGDTILANKAFDKALKLDSSDLYWRAKVESAIVESTKLARTVNASSPASTTQAVVTKISEILNMAMKDAKMAIDYDKTNYYNHLSEARVSEFAIDVRMDGAYDNAVKAYNSAIGLNPFNPSIYLSLANIEARQAKYDDALRDIGRALQVKNNYLEGVFLLSQIYAAKGDINNAIIAAKVAVQLNPQNSLLLFQLGILNYNNKDYKGASEAFAEAVKIQPDYANARYFLGLAYARLNNTKEAIVQFEELAKTNPENQEVTSILTSLKSGKSIFTDTKSTVTNPPEKRSTLPVKEKKK